MDFLSKPAGFSGAAAFLHNTGHFISATGHHKHSAYIVANSDMPGYTDRERIMIAASAAIIARRCPSHAMIFLAACPSTNNALCRCSSRSFAWPWALKQAAAKGGSGGSGCYERSITITVHGEGDIDLEMWAAERAADSFREIYNVPMTIGEAQTMNPSDTMRQYAVHKILALMDDLSPR